MTDEEQIIIDGCNVSECLFYQSNFEEDYDVKIKHFCSNWHNSCESANNSNCYYKQLKRKEQECEKLKKELQAQRDFTAHEQKLIYCVAYDETCKTGNDCKQGKCIFKDNIKLKQTLTEIKEIAKNMNNECFYNDFDCKDCDMQNGCTYFNKKQILQKISECEVK